MSVENKDAPDATPEAEMTVGEQYKEEFEQELDNEGMPIETPESAEEPEETPEGDEPEETEGEPVTGEELKPLDDEEEVVEEEPEGEEGTVPIHVLQKERKRRQALEAQLREPVQAPQAAIPPQPVPMPTPDAKVPVESDYDDRDDFLIAKAAHVAKQELRNEQAQQNAANAQHQAQARQNALQASYEEKVDEEALKKPEAFKDHKEDEAFVNSIQLAGDAYYSIATAERPASIVKYLAKHPAEAVKIAKMHPLQQVEEIGHLKKRSMVAVKPRNVTKAAEPISPERGDSGPPKPVKFSNDMSQGDYEKLLASKGGDNARVGDIME